jgi:long-chain acyl-CoA synthetase
MDKIWLRHYPPGVSDAVDLAACPTALILLEDSFARHGDRVAYLHAGQAWTFRQIDQASRDLAAYLQGLGLRRGDRVAVMLPAVPSYPVAVAAVWRAGLVLVNVDPLLTSRELARQLKDADCSAIVATERAADVLEAALAEQPIAHVVLVRAGDLLGRVRGALVNRMVRRGPRSVPAYHLPQAVVLAQALQRGRRQRDRRPDVRPDDLAMIQYTSGTTGVCKGAMLLHRNVAAAALLTEAWNAPLIRQVQAAGEPFTMVAALPLHHIFGFVVNLLQGWRVGACNVLVPRSRDVLRDPAVHVRAVLKALQHARFHSLTAVETLLAGLLRHPDVVTVDWSDLRQVVAGGMAVHETTARRWRELTGVAISQGYGASETAASVCCNVVTGGGGSAGVGLPMPSTDVALLDETGREVPPGTPGELAVRGPQVMAGYWRRPGETAKVVTADGYLRTGDIALMDSRGQVRILDRVRDVFAVDGFRVYPSEIEEVVSRLPGVRECAVLGLADTEHGAVVRLFVVRDTPDLSESLVRQHCAQHLSGYQRPRDVVFVTELPHDSVGKVLRRTLAGGAPAVVSAQTDALTALS